MIDDMMMSERELELRACAEEAVAACLPVLPMVGSYKRGYTVADRIDTVAVALPEEWTAAALAIGNLHSALNDLPSAEEQLDTDGGHYTIRVTEGRGLDVTPGMVPPDKIPFWVPLVIGACLAFVVIYAAVNL